MNKSLLIILVVVLLVVGAVAALLMTASSPVSTMTNPTTTTASSPTSLALAEAALSATPSVHTQVVVQDASGKMVSRNLVVPDATAVQNIIPFLAIDQMLVCDLLGNCQAITIPLDADEQAVVNGTGGEVSARAVYNADQPGGPVRWLDKIYMRVITRPTATGERWYRNIDLNVSWNVPSEISITRGKNRCNSVNATTGVPRQIFVTLDNSTCDGDGQPAVVRLAAMIAENDVQTCTPNATSTQVCKPFAPITVLPYKRKGFNVVYGDELKNAFQARVILGEPLR